MTFNFRPRPRTTRVIVHCSHTVESVTRTLEYLRAAGRALGLLDVGYHYLIERDGWLAETRPNAVLGSHAPRNNKDSIGVCLSLKGDGEYPHQEQLRTLRHLMRDLHSTFGQLDMVGHSECDHSADCPGFDMDRLRKDCLMPAAQAKALSTQNEILLQYLQTGHTLTNLIALTNLGVGSLSSRVAELRKAGHNIEGEDKADFKGRRYTSYRLA